MVEEKIDAEKLSPEELIKRLEELKNKKKKEIEEAEQLIKKSIDQLRTEEKKQTLVHKIEENKDEDLSEDANETIAAKRIKKRQEDENARNLEERSKREEEQKISVYTIAESNVYNTLKGLTERAQYGTLTKEDENKIDFYNSQIRDRDISYVKNPDVIATLDKAENMLKQIDMYRKGEREKK